MTAAQTTSKDWYPTSSIKINQLIRETAARLEAEGAFAEGNVSAPIPVCVQTDPPFDPTDIDALGAARARFLDFEWNRLDQLSEKGEWFILPLPHSHEDGTHWEFVIHEPRSPVRLKVRLQGDADVVSAHAPVRAAKGISIRLGGHPILMLLRMLFRTEEQIEEWLSNVRDWERYL